MSVTQDLTSIANLAKTVDSLLGAAQGTFLTNIGTESSALNCNDLYQGDAKNTLTLDRTVIANSLGDSSFGVGKRRLETLMRDYMINVGASSDELVDFEQVKTLIRSEMLTNNRAFRSRQVRRGSISANGNANTGGSIVGSGGVERLLVCKKGFNLESGICQDTIALKCLQDQTQGVNAGQEVFQAKSTLPWQDVLDFRASGRGAGIETTITAQSADDSANYIQNPSFSDFSGTTSSPSQISGWTVSVGSLGGTAQIDQSAAGVFRKAACENTAGSLKLIGNTTIYQAIGTTARPLPPATPMVRGFAWRRDANGGSLGSGTLDVYCGSQHLTQISVSAQSGWQQVWFPTDMYNYLCNFTAQTTNSVAGFLFMFVWNGTGQINIDDVQLYPWQMVGADKDHGWRVYWHVYGGATPFQIGDQFTVTDSEPDTAKIQTLMARHAGPVVSDDSDGTDDPTFSYPARPVPPSVGSTTATDGGSGGVCSAGVYSVQIIFVDNQGVRSGPSATITSASITLNHKLAIANIPGGTSGLHKSIEVWCTTAGGSTYYLLATLSQGTTSYTNSTISDATLSGGTSMPAAVAAGITRDDV